MENKKLGNKILHMSSQQAVLERSLQNMQSFHFAEVPAAIKSCLKSSSLHTGSDLELRMCKNATVDQPPS